MSQQEIAHGPFTGIDLRFNKETSPVRTLRQATNVDLTPGGGLKRRGGLRPVITLDSQSKGLYALNGTLRAVIPSGQSIPASATGEVQVIYDAIGTSQSGSYSTGTVALTGGDATVTLSGGTWPMWVDADSTLTITSVAYAVATRNSDTVITLTTPWGGATASGLSYTLTGMEPVAYPTSTIARVSAVEGIGSTAAFGQYPYLCIEKADGTFEHHWVTRVPVSVTDAVRTKVTLPFLPGETLVKHYDRLWATDNVNGVVRFSSIANGPSDWSLPTDAGYLPATSYVSGGSRQITALGLYDNKLAVFFSNAVQLWAVAADPDLISFDRLIDGAGCQAPQSVRNVLGDLFYFSQGGFRSLKTVALTGQIKEDDAVGGPIFALTSGLDGTGAMAVWSPARSQYICALGSTAYVYRYSPSQKIVGWTTYDLGTTIDAAVEFNGAVYLRAGDQVYRIDSAYDDGCAFTVQPAWVAGAKLLRHDFLEVVQIGACQVSYRTDPRNETIERVGPLISETTTPQPLIAVNVCSQALSLVFRGTDPTWQLDRFSLYATPLGR